MLCESPQPAKSPNLDIEFTPLVHAHLYVQSYYLLGIHILNLMYKTLKQRFHICAMNLPFAYMHLMTRKGQGAIEGPN